MKTLSIVALLLTVVIAGLASFEASQETLGDATMRYRINAGGPDLAGGWLRDTENRPFEYVNAEDTSTSGTGQAIDVSHPSLPDGTPAEIFQSERWDPAEDPRMRWRLPVDPGTYEVRLYFAETFPEAFAPGARTFTVVIEGDVVLQDYDVFAAAGGGYRGVMESFTVESDHRLRIAFRNGVQNPAIKGIEVLALGSTVSKPTADPDVAEPTEPTEPSEPTDGGTPTPAPPITECDGVDIASGANVQHAVDSHAAGTTFCLHGTYRFSKPVVPKPGQTFAGPAAIVSGGSAMAFDLTNGAGGVSGVSFIDLDVSGFQERAIECWADMRVIRGRYHHNDRNAIGCGFDYARGHVLIDGAEIDHNGSEDDLGQGSGGMKFARLGEDGLTVRNANIHDNIGNGVWCDVQCIGTFLIEDNVISRNSRKGVHYEKSGASDEYISGRVVQGRAIIRRNVVTDNGWEGRDHAADGGIAGVSSVNMLIEGNITSGNGRGGVFVRTDGRLSGEKNGWQMQAVIRNNDAADGVGVCSEPLVECSNNF
jgi:hypothetical protein